VNRLLTEDAEGAIADFDQVIRESPRDAYAFSQRGGAKQLAGDSKGALEDLTTSIELNPRSCDSFYERARVKSSLGDLEGAISDYERVLEIDPKYAAAYLGRGTLRRWQGDAKGAQGDFERAIELNPKSGAAYYWLGCLRHDGGDLVNALEAFRKACEVDHEYRDYPQLRIWHIRSRKGERDAATEDLAKYVAERKPKDDWYASIAQFLMGRLTERDLLAAAESRHATTTCMRKSQAAYYMGLRLLLDGDSSKAKDCFRKCVEADFKDLKETLSAIAELKALK
jgi:tetratricopeptide (TPR) repeat protein